MFSFGRGNFQTLLFVAVLLVGVARSDAGPFPEITTFESDTDTYVPSNNPFADPGTIYGSPPALGASALGVMSEHGSEGWFDTRSGYSGLIEEVPSGTNGITSSHGAFHGEIWPSLSPFGNTLEGPYGRPSHFDFTNGYAAGNGDHPGAPARWSFQTDLYLDPANSVTSATNPVFPPGYQWGGASRLVDAHFSINHSASNQYDFATALEAKFATGLAAGQWVTLEMRSDYSQPLISEIYNIWNRSHTALLASFEEQTYPYGPSAGITADLSTPVRSYFTNFGPGWTSTDHVTVDNLGVAYAIQAVVLGDMNGDGVVDNFDIAGFALALTDRAAYQALCPTLHDMDYRGDVNGDGALDNFDIAAFQELLTSGASASAVPEPPTLVLLGLGSVGILFFRILRQRMLWRRLSP